MEPFQIPSVYDNVKMQMAAITHAGLMINNSNKVTKNKTKSVLGLNSDQNLTAAS